MHTTKLRIRRDGLELGELSLADARALLAAGFLRPTDCFRVPSAAHEGVLSDLSQFLKNRPDSWLDRFRSTTASAGALVQRTARQAVGQVSRMAWWRTSGVATATNRLLEDYLPHLRREVSRRLGTSIDIAGTQLRDEQFQRKLFGAVYDCLPKPIGRLIGEPAFVGFCLKHHALLLKRKNSPSEGTGRSDH